MKADGTVILSFDGMLNREQLVEVRQWWGNPAVRAAYGQHEQDAPNRLFGTRINEEGGGGGGAV